MKIATWNVNSLNARLPRVLEFLELHRPDLLLMQETKVDPDKFPDAALADAGYHAVHHSRGRWAGVAIAAPVAVALEDPRPGLDGEPDPDEARWLEVTAGTLRVVTTYVPNGREVDSPFYEGKLRFLDAAAERIRALSRRRAGRRGGLQRLPGRPRRLRPGRVRRLDARHPGGARALPALLEAGTVDAFRAAPPRRARLHLVGLPRGPLPQEDGPADRRGAAVAAGRRAARRSAGSTATSARARSPPTTRRCWSS